MIARTVLLTLLLATSAADAAETSLLQASLVRADGAAAGTFEVTNDPDGLTARISIYGVDAVAFPVMLRMTATFHDGTSCAGFDFDLAGHPIEGSSRSVYYSHPEGEMDDEVANAPLVRDYVPGSENDPTLTSGVTNWSVDAKMAELLAGPQRPSIVLIDVAVDPVSELARPATLCGTVRYGDTTG